MANSFLNLRTFPFFDSVKNPVKESKTSDSFYNAGYQLMTLEVSGTGTGTLKVQGCVNTMSPNGEQLDDDDCSWTDIKVSEYSSDEKAATISATGIYKVYVAGLSRIRIKAETVSGDGLTIVGTFLQKF